MISMERLLSILEDWARWMKSDSHKLGYPSKSIGMSSGGESTSEVFEEMCSSQDLGAKPPLAYPWQLDMAYDNLLNIAGRRINA